MTSMRWQAEPAQAGPVTPVELFFDMVFVFTLTQLTGMLERERKSVHFVVSADRLKKNGFGTFMLNEAEDDSEVIASAAGPGAFAPPLELVGTKPGILGVVSEDVQSCSDVLSQ